MEISDILAEEMIFTELKATNKRDLFMQVSSLLADKYDLDANMVFEALWERENLGSTGYGNGVAFPHARITGINKVLSAFVRLDNTLDYDTADGQNVDVLAFMLSPENSGNDHLQTLALYSRLLKNPGICQDVRAARSQHEIYVALQK